MNMPEERYKSLTHFTRKCETCGKVMKHVGATRRFCADCTRERNRVQRSEHRARKAAMAVDKGDGIVEIPKPSPHLGKPTQDNSLGAVCARANAAGRTYGQQVEFERRQKELKDRGEI